MPAILDLLYREYCRARLAEMRKQLFIRRQSQDVSEADRDTSGPDCAAIEVRRELGSTCNDAVHLFRAHVNRRRTDSTH
jgi:hypothetical protein